MFLSPTSTETQVAETIIFYGMSGEYMCGRGFRVYSTISKEIKVIYWHLYEM
jgi:hypothetical protein